MPFRDLNVLDAAEQAATWVTALIDRWRRPPLLHARQLRDSAQSVVANIAEGFGRGTSRARARSPAITRGKAEEAIRHPSANCRANHLGPKVYRPVHHLPVVIVKMPNPQLTR
jgi:four helix bundle protein